MKKILAIVLCVCMAMTLAACGAEEDPTTEDPTTEAPTEPTTERATLPVDAPTIPEPEFETWAVYDGINKVDLTEEAQKAFDTAMQGYNGAIYDPIALLGTQVVAGINYAILCKQTVVVLGKNPELKVLYIYQDLQGNAEVTDVCDFKLDDLADVAEPVSDAEDGEVIVGGFTPYVDQTEGALDAVAKEAFEEAIEGYEGLAIVPLSALGRLTVGAGGYAYLSVLTPVIPDATSNLGIVFVYTNDDEIMEIQNVTTLDIASFKAQ